MSEKSIVVLKDEDGREVRFSHIMTFDYDGSFYVALLPVGEVEGAGRDEVLLMEIREDEDASDCYLPVENEQQLEKVWEEFKRLYYEDE